MRRVNPPLEAALYRLVYGDVLEKLAEVQEALRGLPLPRVDNLRDQNRAIEYRRKTEELMGKLNDILQGVNWGLDDKVEAVIPFN